MHFLTSQSEAEQISEVCQFFSEHLLKCVQNPKSELLNNFENKMADLDDASDPKGVLEYILSI